MLTVRVSPANGGSVRLESAGVTEIALDGDRFTCFNINYTITATALPGSGYRFDRWSLSPTQSGFVTGTNPTTFKHVDVAGGKTLTVYFSSGTTPPPATLNPPANVQASKGTYSDRVRITWNASSGATSYDVYRSTSVSAAKSRIGTSSATSFTDTNLTCGVNYYYWVKAVNASGASDFSNWSVGYCQGSQPPPPPAQGVTPVSPTEAKKMLDERVGLIVVDASDPRDYDREHILCALNATWESNFESLDYKNIGLEPYKASDILIYDQKNTFGQTAAEYLAKQGFASVYYLTGGLDAWMAADLETVPCSYECGNCGLPPMAHAGPDKEVEGNQTFTLDGSGSVNPGAGALTYLWKQYNPGNQSPKAIINNPGAAQPTVIAPNVQEGGETIVFHLTVTDSLGRKNMDSVDVKVKWAFENRPPTARAGADQEVDAGDEVVLDGSASSDPDDGIATYQWVQTDGPNVTLTGAATAEATFTAPDAATEDLVFELTVTDEAGQSDTDEVIVTVRLGNQNPIADAGEDQTVGETAEVTLDGSASDDPDGDALSYEWRQVAGRSVDLGQPFSARAMFQAPMVSGDPIELIFELEVRDNKGGVDIDRVVVTVTDVGEPPFADAGRSRMVFVDDTVTLDGFGSFDLDGEIVSYQWAQVNTPEVTMIGKHTATASFTAPYVEEGQVTLIFQLTVTDDTGLTDSDTVKIGVKSGTAPPVVSAGDDQIVNEGDNVVLDGYAASTLTEVVSGYRWKQVSGPEVVLSDAAVRAPEFKAPKVSLDLTVLSFELSVDYENGRTYTDTVDVYIKKKNCSSSSTCFISTLTD